MPGSRSSCNLIPSPCRLFSLSKTNTLQPRTKAARELVVLQEKSRPTSQKRLVSFQGSSLRKEATPRHRLKEEAGNGRWPQSQSLQRWPHCTSHPFGTLPLKARAGGTVLYPTWALASAASSLWLCIPCFSGAWMLLGLAGCLPKG